MKRYHPALVALHWIMAILILLALVMGSQVMAELPNSDPAKVDLLRNHMIVGGLILVLLIARFVTRRRTEHPPEADTGNALLNRLAPLTHWAFYLLVLGMCGSGIALSILSGLPDAVFGNGALPESFDAFTPRIVHGAIATLLGLLIAAHVAAALYHQFMLKDGLFARMWFGNRRG